MCSTFSYHFNLKAFHRFSNKQMVKLKESLDDVPAGQTPYGPTPSSSTFMASSLTPASPETISVNGVYCAMPMRVSSIVHNIRAVYKIPIDVVHFWKTDYRYEQNPGLKARKCQRVAGALQEAKPLWEADSKSSPRSQTSLRSWPGLWRLPSMMLKRDFWCRLKLIQHFWKLKP